MVDRPATQQDVMLALLAYDAYSRGVKPQVLKANNDELPTEIGTAHWVQSSDDIPGATAIGFSASEYTLSGGKTVISYRGTDFPVNSSDTGQLLNFLGDFATGWLASFGVTGGAEFNGAKLQM